MQITLRGPYGERIQEDCVEDRAPSGPPRYRALMPGQSMSTTVTLGCFELTNVEALSVEVVYRDYVENPPDPPNGGVVLVRGPFVFGPQRSIQTFPNHDD